MREYIKLDLSICIVTYNACEHLRDCLRSIEQFPPVVAYEILVIDNGSKDGTKAMLQGEYPRIRLIQNATNQGYTRPLNQAMQAAHGDVRLAINPDTLLTQDMFNPMLAFMQAHPDVGVAIPKVLNRDGSFQKQCRRGEARPVEVIGYFTGLYRLFPQNKKLGGYLQTWLPEDEIVEVKAVSGSCMFIRREALEQVGYFDKRFYAYQEDSDFCFQIRKLGWKVYYVPTTSIIHYGGEGGSGVKPFQGIFQWHRSYFLYYNKNLAKDYCFLFNWLFYGLMLGKFVWGMIVTIFRRRKVVGTPKP